MHEKTLDPVRHTLELARRLADEACCQGRALPQIVMVDLRNRSAELPSERRLDPQ